MDLIERRLTEARAERERYRHAAEVGLAYREGAVAALEALRRDALGANTADKADTPPAAETPAA